MTREVLIIDDDRDIREALRDTLEDEGYVVRTANNGREALAGLEQDWHPSVILLDLMMPIMDGWEFRRRQLAQPGLAGIPVLVVSADRNADRAAGELGVAGYLRKPLMLQALLDTLGRIAG